VSAKPDPANDPTEKELASVRSFDGLRESLESEVDRTHLEPVQCKEVDTYQMSNR